MAYPPVALLRALGLAPLPASLTLIATAAFLCALLLYLTLRHLGLKMIDAVLGCLVFLSSATFVHWFCLVETYALTSLTAILAVYLLVRTRAAGAPSAIMASAISLMMVTTNWTLGLALVAMKFPLSKAVRYTAVALALCIVASIAQRQIFPWASHFFNPHAITAEREYASLDDAIPSNPP